MSTANCDLGLIVCTVQIAAWSTVDPASRSRRVSQGTVDTQSVVETYREIEQSLTAPGAPFEMTSTIVRGEPVRTYRNAESSLYDVFAALGRSGGDNLLVA